MKEKVPEDPHLPAFGPNVFSFIGKLLSHSRFKIRGKKEIVSFPFSNFNETLKLSSLNVGYLASVTLYIRAELNCVDWSNLMLAN